jgi:hypothetical protein
VHIDQDGWLPMTELLRYVNEGPSSGLEESLKKYNEVSPSPTHANDEPTYFPVMVARADHGTNN